MEAGSYAFFARALDNEGQWSQAARGTLVLVASDDHGNDAASATPIAIGDTVSGSLELAWDGDWFSFQAVAGTTYLFDTELVDLGDSVLYLYDTNGTSLLDYNDDYDWTVDLSSRISWTAEADGTYYLSVYSFCEAFSGDYTLIAATIADDHGNSWGTATAVSVGDSVAGDIEYGTDIDYFAVDLEAGGHYSFQTGLLGLDDSFLYLYGPGGWELLDYGDDISWPDDPASRIEWTAEISGTYYLAVEAFDPTSTGDYTLDVQLINFAPILEPINDQLLSAWQDSLDVTLAADDADGDSLAYWVQVLGTDTYAELAYSLDQELGLYQHRIGYLENVYGANEKFIASNDGWYFILPNGEFYRWESTIGYAEVSTDPAVEESQWFQLQAEHDGYLSIEAMLAETGTDVTLRLRDANYMELAMWDSMSAEIRLDFIVSAGETYYVEVAGQADLRLANLVQLDGETVVVHGTEGDDYFEFSAGERYQIVVNGIMYSFGSDAVSRVTIDGGTGNDTAIVIGSSGDDTAYMRPNWVTTPRPAATTKLTFMTLLATTASMGRPPWVTSAVMGS